MLSSTSPIDRPSLHPGTRYLIAPRVPHGLASVVEGLTREVLRHRPEDIYIFAAHHFEKLLKLREQYYAEEYSGREFDHDFGCDFKLWPTKRAKDIGRSTNSDWSLEKEIFEGRGKVSADVEESTDVSTDRENRKTSKQTCTRSLSTTKKSSKKSKDNETTSDIRATRIISQMSVLPGKNIQTKDIKQELRRNKLSGEKARATDNTEKGIRNERRSRMRISKTDKDPEEDVERTTTTTSSSRTSARRPLRKVRRIETESETETETISGETTTKTGHENGSSTKNNGANSETITRIENREKRPEAQFSEHSSKRKVSSRALSMDHIRAYVLRKFASSASLEVLRSPTYVEQVQEVIDRAAPIIKEKLEEVRGSRGKRSRSVDLAWNKEFFRQRSRDGKKCRDYEKEEESKGKTGNELPERKVDTKEETESHLERDEMISNVETEEKKSRRRSGGSGKKARKRENGGDVGVVDQINGKHSDKLEYESGATHDTLEAKLTATQNILEDISKSTYDLGGGRKNDSAGGELPESEISDHANVVSLPIVRPPSSRNSRSATKNGSDSLILPPISPEAPKSTKKKDELSLPVLPVATNGNHSKKSQDAEEASTMHDITNDIEDIAILPEDQEEVIVDTKEDLDTDLISSTVSDVIDAEKREKDKDTDDVLLENISEQFIEKCESLEEYEELERKKMEEIFKDSLNVTPEVVDMPPRPDSLEPDEEKKLQNDDLARVNTFDELKDKLIEIEMAERNIEMALAGQQLVMHDAGEETSQVEKSMIDGKINDVGKLADEMEETVSEIEKADTEKISTNKDDEEKKRNDEEGKNTTNEIENVKDVIEISMNEKENLLNITEKSKDEVKEEIERSSNEMKNTTNEAEASVNKIEKSSNKLNETEILTNEVEMTNQEEILTKAAEEVIKVSEDEKSTDENERSINEKSPTDVEKLTVKIQRTEDAQSINLKSQNNDDQSQAAVCETDDDNVTASNNKADNTVNEFSKTVACESAANEREISATDLPDENTAKATKERRKREIDSCPTTSLSLELPFSYVLSEGSPCEIPDSVTTVIIPDRHYSSPATLEDENYQFESTNEKESFNTNSNIAEKSETQENKNSMEIFGEYIQPEVDILPDIDFVHNMRGVKSSQIIIAHQDLDKIKEEGEEEETKDVEKEEIETPREQKDDTQSIIHEEETKPVILEGIVEHEENEETMKMTSESRDAEEISCKISKYESSPDTVELMADTGLIDEENMNLVVESRDTMENSSEENGSTQDTHTITSSDVKESTVSNQSIESPSLDRPIVPELNLDSLQDNTVSSFKMTANGTVTKENNDSPRESDTTTSLIEPLISDERLMNQPTLADREEDIAAEELMESLRSEVPETDQLYQAEHAEYEWLEKDPSSLETNLEDEVKSQENSIGLKALPEDVVVVGPLLRDEEMEKKIDNEEEIARELIGSLEEDMQLYGKALEEKSKENGESEKSSLNMNDKPNQSLLESVDEQEKGEHDISSEEIQTLDKITRTETINELSSQMEDIKQDSEDKNIALVDNETEELKLQVEEKDGIEITHVAPLAQFEQELLEFNDTQIIKTDEEKITIENKLDTDTVSTDNQENLENSQTNIEEVIESQSNENINKIEELHEQQEKNEEVQDREEYEPEKLEVEEKEEQEKLEIDKEYQQEQSEKCTQEDLKIEETDNHENLQLEENVVDIKTIPLEATESRKGSINESTNNNNEGKTEPIICDKFIIDDETEKETKNNEIEKSEDLSAKIQNIHEPISEQSTKDHFHGGYWITETKSSTVETVIGTSTSNEGMEPDADVPEIIQDESLIQREDDFHSAVVKIQACIRGFLMRRRMKEDASSKSVSNNISSAQKIDIDDHLTVPHSSSSREVKTGRQRLRREEALRNTTLSLENAFATGRLQHTGEFHDSVPLALFDPIYRKDNSTTSDKFLNKAIEEDAEQTNQSDITKSNVDENNSVHDDKHGGSFQKGNIFADHSTIPIVMHLLADASRNCHFTVSQNSHPDFNTNAGGAKPSEPTLTDILMLGYPRDDENRYLNFITSVEDLGCNMDSLSLNNTIKCSKNTDDADPSTTSGEGSIREPLALPGFPQGVVIEEVTSLETELVPSESTTKPSITSKTSLDTNSSVPSEECTLEDEKNDLGTSPRIVDAMEDRKHIDGETEKQKSDCKHLESISEDDSHSEDAKKESSEVSCDNHERVEEEKNEKT